MQRAATETEAEAAWSARLWWWAAALALVSLVFLAFGEAARYGLTNWDDFDNFRDNPHLQNFGVRELRWAWTTAHLGVFQPIGWMLLGAEWRLSHGQPGFVHFVSVLFHGINAVVLWRLLEALLERALPASEAHARRWSAWLAAALFAVHPLRTEAAVWASCQPYLPSILFFMLSLLAYLGAQDDPQTPRARRMLVASWALFAAAVLSKAVAVSLPVFLIVLDVYPLRRLGPGVGWTTAGARDVWRQKVPFFAIALATTALALWARHDAHGLVPLAAWSWAQRIAQPSYSLWFYLVKTVVPWPLSGYYYAPPDLSLAQVRFLLPFSATLVAGGMVILLRRRAPWLAAAVVGYLVLLAPNVGVVRIGQQLAADRYSYLSSLPWVACGAGALCRIVTRARFIRLVQLLGAGALCGLVLLSRRQTATWRDSLALWTQALVYGGADSVAIHANRGAGFVEQHRTREAMAEYMEAYRLDPRAWLTNANLGGALAELGRNDEALVFLERAVEADPKEAVPHFSLGTVLQKLGKVDRARAALEKAIQLRPAYPDALTNLALLEIEAGHEAKGQALLEKALGAKPTHFTARFNLGALFFNQGKVEAGIEQYQTLLRQHPAADRIDSVRQALAQAARTKAKGALPFEPVVPPGVAVRAPQ